MEMEELGVYAAESASNQMASNQMASNKLESLEELATLDQLELADQVTAFEMMHDNLRAKLAELDSL
jgi:hypothetical protein